MRIEIQLNTTHNYPFESNKNKNILSYLYVFLFRDNLLNSNNFLFDFFYLNKFRIFRTGCYRKWIRKKKMTLLFKIAVSVLLSLCLLMNTIYSGKIESRLRVGRTINVFVRYGYLGISMKVISYNDTERWLFKEPTYNVFQVRFQF